VTMRAEHVDSDVTGVATSKRHIIKVLLEIEDDLGGRVPTAAVRDAANELQVSERTVWRWLEQSRDTGPAQTRRIDWMPDDAFFQVYAAHRGNVAATIRDLQRAGVAVPNYATVRRRLRECDQTRVQGAVSGLKGLRSKQVYRVRHVPHRNHTWEIDHTEAPVWVLHPVSTKPVKPWITVVEDAATRFVLSLQVTYARPSSNEVVAAIASAMLARPLDNDGAVSGGRPTRCQWDQGADLLSDHVTSMMLELGIDARPVAAYSPHQNGKVEAFNKIMKAELLTKLPGYSKGPKFGRDNPFLTGGGKKKKPVLLTGAQFEELLSEWLDVYNHERGHGQLNGRTPAEVWVSDDYELRHVDPDEIWPAMLAVERRKVGPTGVRLNNRHYMCAELTRRVGQHVQARYLPNHPDFIEVFDETGRIHIGTAFDTLDDDQWQEVSAIRREQFSQVKRDIQGSAQRRVTRALERPEDNTFTNSVRKSDADELLELEDAVSADELLELEDEASADEPPTMTEPGPADDRPRDGTDETDDDEHADLLDLEPA
jgi:putative transposase